MDRAQAQLEFTLFNQPNPINIINQCQIGQFGIPSATLCYVICKESKQSRRLPCQKLPLCIEEKATCPWALDDGATHRWGPWTYSTRVGALDVQHQHPSYVEHVYGSTPQQQCTPHSTHQIQERLLSLYVGNEGIWRRDKKNNKELQQ